MDEDVVPSTTQSADITWLRGVFNRDLFDLGQLGDCRLSGIYSPIYNKNTILRFMSRDYESMEGVEAQINKYDLTENYLSLITEALEMIHFPREGHQELLELGCGFGNATFSLLKIFPNAHVIASDLSTSMLSALKSKLGETTDRCLLLQLDAEDLDFKPETFDLIVGAAILHHLFHPEFLIEKIAKVLKPGGCAIFFEPFENGYSIMGLIFRAALKDRRSLLMSPQKRAYLRNCVSTWNKMKNTDKSDPYFTGVDDKWIFPKQYLIDLVKQRGLRECIIYPLDKTNIPFTNRIKSHLEGNGIVEMPRWFWQIVNDFEEFFSINVKKDLLTEGCVIILK